jgi:hypothetical protein
MINRKKEIFFGIKIITCNRKKFAPVKDLVFEALESVKKQRYPHWRVYLIGDHYQPEEEFRQLTKFMPRDKVLAYNLKGHTPEREIFKKINHLPLICGNKVSNFCLDLMESTDIRYVACLDDDDLWTPYHLESLHDEFTKFPAPALVCTMANYQYTGILPSFKVDEKGQLKINTLSCNVAHSAVAWDMSKLPHRYRRRLIDVAWNKQYGDADMWEQMEWHCAKYDYPTAVSNNVTVEVR